VLAQTYARSHGALLATVEHRFYGKSQPLSDWSAESLAFAGAEQALEDLAHFRVVLFENMSLPASTPVVLFGGSYGGCLAAWGRLRYPHLFNAAVASSAPLQKALGIDSYLEVVSASIATRGGVRCQQAVRAGMAAVQVKNIDL